MKTIKNLIALTFILFCSMQVFSQWDLVWSDEFNSGSQPSTSKWKYDLWAPGQVNNEWQSYTNRWENVRIENGMLIIEARRDWGNGYEYTSGRINSTASWTYGRIEARMRLPGGWGTWPAFWLYPDNESIYGWNSETNYWWPNCGEIDIMEEVGYDQNTIHASVHSKNFYFKLGNQRTGTTYVGDATSAFHVYAAEWFENRIDFYVDGNKYFTVWNDWSGWESWPYNHNFHIILNLAVGGDWGGAQGVDPNIWPRRMEVDYVRVYKPSSGGDWTITLKGSNGQYVSSENGQSAMMCNRNSAQGWEKFDVIDAGGGKFALRGTNGMYVSSENGQSAMMCNRSAIGDWEKFTWIELGGNNFAMLGNNGRYVCSENGSSGMTCNRTAIGGWETFTWATTTKSASDVIENTDALLGSVPVYPNPANDMIFVTAQANTTVNIYDQSGRLIHTELVLEASNAYTIDVSSFAAGVYIVQQISGDQINSDPIIIR